MFCKGCWRAAPAFTVLVCVEINGTMGHWQKDTAKTLSITVPYLSVPLTFFNGTPESGFRRFPLQPKDLDWCPTRHPGLCVTYCTTARPRSRAIEVGAGRAPLPLWGSASPSSASLPETVFVQNTNYVSAPCRTTTLPETVFVQNTNYVSLRLLNKVSTLPSPLKLRLGA